MLRDRHGQPFALRGWNPLMAEQENYKPPNGEYVKWDLYGMRYPLPAESKPPAPVQQPAPQPAPPPEEDRDMLRNADGTPFDVDGQAKLDMYDPCSSDKQLLDCVDQEQIELAGAPIEYYRVMVDSRMDDLYHEQRQKLILGTPICMKAVYEPTTPILQMGGIGPAVFDSIEQLTFHVNKSQFISLVGEMPRVQGLIRTVDDGIFWEIAEVQVNLSDQERKIWSKHRLALVCSKYRPTATDRSPSLEGREQTEAGRLPVRVR